MSKQGGWPQTISKLPNHKPLLNFQQQKSDEFYLFLAPNSILGKTKSQSSLVLMYLFLVELCYSSKVVILRKDSISLTLSSVQPFSIVVLFRKHWLVIYLSAFYLLFFFFIRGTRKFFISGCGNIKNIWNIFPISSPKYYVSFVIFVSLFQVELLPAFFTAFTLFYWARI